jgi:tRNA-specific 2-thiouridylase
VWAGGPVTGPAEAQCSAHGVPRPAQVEPAGSRGERAVVRFERRQRRVAPGQSVVLYHGDEVVGGGVVAR